MLNYQRIYIYIYMSVCACLILIQNAIFGILIQYLHKFVTEIVVFCDGLKPPRWRMQVFYAFMFLYLYVYIHGVQYLFFVYIHVL